MVAVEENTRLEEAVKLMNKEGLSRIPVYKNNINNITGFIYAKDFLIGDLEKQLTKSINLLGLIHPSYLVSENKRVTTLLKEFQRKKVHIAVVINKDKKISGVVTIEDLLEEIFGEIEDEHDMIELVEKQLSDKEYIFSGRLEIDDINEKYKLNIKESEDYDTLAGFIFYHYEKIPKMNERFTIDNFEFKILKVSKTRIEVVHLFIIEND